MRTDPDARVTERLTAALRTEADRVEPDPRAWSDLERRLARPVPRTRPGLRRRWYGPAAAGAALGLVVAGLAVVTSDGLHRSATPAPAQTPSTSTPATPTAPRTDGRFRPSAPRAAWTVYRTGPAGLYADAVPATAPYDPAQAVRALFDRAPTVPGAVALPNSSSNRVASVHLGDDGVVTLDMAAVDEVTRPQGAAGRAQARLWVSSWARTVSDPYGPFRPVRITLQGRPTTLYGVVDTTGPLFGDSSTTIERPAGITFPADGAEVTSPVAVAAMPAAVGDRLVVQDPATGRTAAAVSAVAGADGRRALVSTSTELAPGAYALVLRSRSGRVEAQRRFTVTGADPAPPAQGPVSDAPTVALASTLVSYPGPDGELIVEPRLRTTLAAAVAETSGEPTSNRASWPFGALTVGSVTERDGTVVVDYATDAKVRPRRPDAAVAQDWAQSLVHTVAAYLGRPVPVQVTLQGRPFRLFDVLDTTAPLTFRERRTTLTTGLSLPSGVPAASPVPVVGVVDHRVDQLTWYVDDPISGGTLYEGVAPVAPDRTYAFGVPLASGQYVLRIDVAAGDGHPATSRHQPFTVG